MRWVIRRGFAGSLLLTLGGLCYVRVTHKGWVDHVRLLMDIRASPQRLDVGLPLCFAGLLLLTWAWWDLRRFARDESSGVRDVRTAVAWWCVPLLVAPPLFSGDGWSYVANGYLTGHGLSPYIWTPSVLPPALQSGVSPHWLFTPSPYGPLAVGWGGLASQLTSNPWLLLFAYRLMALLGLALLAWATPRLARRCGRNPGEASWLVVASPFVLAHGIGGLHNDLVMVGLGAAALALTRREQWVWGAVLVGASAAVKVPGGLVGVGVVLLSLAPGAGLFARLRRTAEVAAVAAGTLVGLGFLVGVGVGWVSALSVATLVRDPLSPTFEIGERLRRLIIAAGLSNGLPVIHIVQILGSVMVVAFAALLLLRRRAEHDGAVLAALATLMLTLTVMNPVEHYWYFLWCLPLLAFVRMPPPAAGALTCAVVVLGLTAVVDPSLPVSWFPRTGSLAVFGLPLLTYAVLAVRARLKPEDLREPVRAA